MIGFKKERLGIKRVKITAIILLRRNSLRMCACGSLTLAVVHNALSYSELCWKKAAKHGC